MEKLLKAWIIKRRKNRIVKELATYGVIVCRPEDRCLEELMDALSVFHEDKGECV